MMEEILWSNNPEQRWIKQIKQFTEGFPEAYAGANEEYLTGTYAGQSIEKKKKDWPGDFFVTPLPQYSSLCKCSTKNILEKSIQD